MPIYEYACEKCGTFELSQRITEPAVSKCPTCRHKVQRLISSTSFKLQGGGWYGDLYASKKPEPAKAASGKSPPA